MRVTDLAELLNISKGTVSTRLAKWDWSQWPLGDIIELSYVNEDIKFAFQKFFNETDVEPSALRAQADLSEALDHFIKLTQLGWNQLKDNYLDANEAAEMSKELQRLLEIIPQLIANLDERAKES